MRESIWYREFKKIKSIAGSAELLCGGKPPERVGYYFPATVLADCKPGTPAYDDELFGPVASVIKARAVDDGEWSGKALLMQSV